MKQVLQSLRTGATEVAEVPRPIAGNGQLLIRTTATLVSPGTERMLIDFGRAGWLERARQQPDKVRMVLDKIKADGLLPTVEAVSRKLDVPLPMGYCNVGVIAEVGPGVVGFAVGDRVASNGTHAQYVAVPMNLCARVPESVTDEAASFTVLGAIALQGIRLANPTLGECVAVTGLGLIGLITVQLLRAQGCRVLGIDPDPARVELARRFGAEGVDIAAGEDPVKAGMGFSRGRGLDAVIITASTPSSEPVRDAALMSRKRGRIVLVGVTGLKLSRADFFEKELTFQVSCSYGPGRYDSEYEEKGRDYPIGFVRWTEQRNFEAVLDMMADGRLELEPLVSHRFGISEAEKAYALITSDAPSLGVMLEFSQPNRKDTRDDDSATVLRVNPAMSARPATLGFIGAGNYADAVLIPSFRAAGARLKTVVSAAGVSGTHAARKHGFELSTTDAEEVIADPDINAVVIATRHSSHARWVCAALEAGKGVFVEKPLATTGADIDAIGEAMRRRGPNGLLMVGFNRRFAPQVRRIRELLATTSEPRSFVMTVNAGAIEAGHWTQDPEVGGGRVIGEVCHFIDLLRFLADAPIARHAVAAVRGTSSSSLRDTLTLNLEFVNGSIGTVHYFANGHRSLAKERLDVFVQGRVLQLDNFRRMSGHGWPGFSRMNLWRQDKGPQACTAAFVEALEGRAPPPIPLEQLLEVSRVTLEVSEALAR